MSGSSCVYEVSLKATTWSSSLSVCISDVVRPQGFKLDTHKYEVFKTYSLVVLRGEGVEPAVVPWPNAAIPEFVGRACE
eukprot:26775-Eustigmatos_ZCMA.PRE.1